MIKISQWVHKNLCCYNHKSMLWAEPLDDYCFNFTDGFKDWAILPCKLQYNTRNQKGKDKLLWASFHIWVKSQKGGRPAGQLGMFFLLPKDGSRLRWLGTTRTQPWITDSFTIFVCLYKGLSINLLDWWTALGFSIQSIVHFLELPLDHSHM